MTKPLPHMDEIKIATVLVGLRDFADRPDYCPKVMKEKLSECIKDLQALYHAGTAPNPQTVSGAALEALSWFCNQCDNDDEGDASFKEFIKSKANIIKQALQVQPVPEGMVLVPKEDNAALKIALYHHINADAYASTFPDDESDSKALKKQETWNRLQARTFISDSLEEECSQEFKQHYTHKWDADGERCVKCGDKDWYNDPICRAAAAQKNGE